MLGIVKQYIWGVVRVGGVPVPNRGRGYEEGGYDFTGRCRKIIKFHFRDAPRCARGASNNQSITRADSK